MLSRFPVLWGICVLLLSLPFLAWGESTCSLERRAGYADFVPVMGGEFADQTLFAAIRKGYRLVDPEHKERDAEVLLQNILETALRKKNRCAEGLIDYELGRLARIHHAVDAQDLFLKAEEAFEHAPSPLGLARVHYQLAQLVAMRGENREAGRLFRENAEELTRLGDTANAILSRLQQVQVKDGDKDAEYPKLLSEALEAKEPLVGCYVLHRWGDTETMEGKYASAMEHYTRAEHLLESDPVHAIERAYLQVSIGRLERLQGRPQAALPHYRLAIALEIKAHDVSYAPEAMNAMGVAYEAMHDYPRALRQYQKALVMAHHIQSQPFIDFLEANIGGIYVRLGKPAQAVPLLDRAVTKQKSMGGQCIRRNQLSEAYRLLGRSENAAKEATEAIAACEQAKQNETLAAAYCERARAQLDEGKLDAALVDVRKAQLLIEKIRAQVVPEDAHKSGYAQRQIDISDTEIAILMRQHQFAEALAASERARSRAFLDLLSASRSSTSAVAVHTEERSVATNPSVLTARGDLHAIFLKEPFLLKSEALGGPIELPEILSTLKRLQSTLLAYWLTDDTLYIWVARPNRPVYGVVRKVKSSEFQKLIGQTELFKEPAARGGAIESRGGQKIALRDEQGRAWRELYRLLVAPVASELPSEPGALLTIVPHGSLFRVAFPALIDNRGSYLIENYTVHTVPAVGVLRYTTENDRLADQHPAHYVFVANPAHFPILSAGMRLPPLPATEREVKGAARLFPANQVTLLDGEKAGIGSLEKTLQQATVLHFATHAIVSDTDPFASFLALDRDSENGELTAAQIYGLNLHAKLVVLSACRTGLGKISGDGVAGLSRAFFASGAASVLSTLWDVADEPTARLLPRFYKELSGGSSRAAALRAAQLALISDLRRGKVSVNTPGGRVVLPEEPLFWAAFSLSGEP